MRYTIDVVRKAFENEGYTLLSDTYISNKKKLNYKCPEGHIHSIAWADWLHKDARCPYCNGRPIHTLDEVRKSFALEGYVLLTKEYLNNKQKLDYICPHGHKYTICYSSWLQGRRCYLCNGNIKKNILDIKTSLEQEGYNLMSENYIGCQDHLTTKCPNGHTYSFTWDNWSSKGSRCSTCGSSGVSKEEVALRGFISEHAEVSTNNRFICKPKELDIVIPDKKIAIEYCGLYWHSELTGKGESYHLKKLEHCLNNNYKLITVFADEFRYKNAICRSRLLSYIDRSSFIKIYARNCKVVAINAKQAHRFCEENHLQGYGAGSSIKLGLLYNDALVAVMTFSKPSIAKGHKIAKEGIWELHRFCSKLNTEIVGGASKLLKYFERNYPWSELFSYADRRWSDGALYTKLGFEFDQHTKPNYWYLKDQCYERFNRFSLRKKADEPKDISEWELRKAQGYTRIWDCGNLKYVKYNKGKGTNHVN